GMLLLGALAQTDDVATLAAEHGIDNPQDLVAASDTVGVTPAVYVRTTWPHAPPPPPTPPVSGVWARLAQCESTSNWRANTGNGYFGGLQFDRQTWAAYGGLTYASSAHLATPAQQIAVAEKLRAARGFQPWPACSRRLGLR